MIIEGFFTRFYVFTCLWLSIAILNIKISQKMSDQCRNAKNLKKNYVGRFFRPYIDFLQVFYFFA